MKEPLKPLQNIDVSVLICTRNRPKGAGETIASVLRNDIVTAEIVVIDQSDGRETEEAIANLANGSSVRYVRSDSRGLSRARNEGLRLCSGAIVLMTDDDCIVAPDWVEVMHKEFLQKSRPAIVFGNVCSPPVSGDRVTPVSISRSPFTVARFRDWRSPDGLNVGIGASMAIDREFVLGIGGFDTVLGAGAEFKSGEDTDMAIRCLIGGRTIFRTSDAAVEHFGARSNLETRSLVRGAMFSIGALHAKYLRCGELRPLYHLLTVGWTLILRVVIVDLCHGRKPPVLGRAVHLAKGFCAGLRAPLDRERRVFCRI